MVKLEVLHLIHITSDLCAEAKTEAKAEIGTAIDTKNNKSELMSDKSEVMPLKKSKVNIKESKEYIPKEKNLKEHYISLDVDKSFLVREGEQKNKGSPSAKNKSSPTEQNEMLFVSSFFGGDRG